MTYDTKNKILQISEFEKIKLTYRENKLLVCLSDGNLTKYEDILKELGIRMDDLRRLEQRLLDDTKYQLNIETMEDGYELKSKIYFK